MAAAASLSPLIAPRASPNAIPRRAFPSARRLAVESRHRRRVLAMGGADLLGDLGARDPFPEEIESNFGENVVGNTDTLHRILVPNLRALSLAQLSCEAIPPSQPPLADDDAEKLLKKVKFYANLFPISILFHVI